jgi:SAM-dependent methyltransferase
MRLANVARALRDDGVVKVARRVSSAALPRQALARLGVLESVDGRHGLEIGGPSQAFGRMGVVPVYLAAERIDNCNFAAATLWEGQIAEGRTFRFNVRRPPGEQFIAEATELDRVASGAYDFVLSSHAIEHCANPLKALAEWSRVLKPGGLLVLVVPHSDGAFDHRRPLTTLAHLVDDFERGVGEDDMTHLDEIVRLHDLGRDPGADDLEGFRARALGNADTRSLHHHVFDTALALAMVERAGFGVLRAERPTQMDIVVLARRGLSQ